MILVLYRSNDQSNKIVSSVKSRMIKAKMDSDLIQYLNIDKRNLARFMDGVSVIEHVFIYHDEEIITEELSNHYKINKVSSYDSTALETQIMSYITERDGYLDLWKVDYYGDYSIELVKVSIYTYSTNPRLYSTYFKSEDEAIISRKNKIHAAIETLEAHIKADQLKLKKLKSLN